MVVIREIELPFENSRRRDRRFSLGVPTGHARPGPYDDVLADLQFSSGAMSGDLVRLGNDLRDRALNRNLCRVAQETRRAHVAQEMPEDKKAYRLALSAAIPGAIKSLCGERGEGATDDVIKSGHY